MNAALSPARKLRPSEENVYGSDPKQMTGYLYVLAAAVLWSLIGLFSKICMEEGLCAAGGGLWRALLGGICFLPKRASAAGRASREARAVLLPFGKNWSISVFFSSLQISIQLSGAAMAMVLLYTAPAWVAVFSPASCSMRASSRKGIAWVGPSERRCAPPAEA